MKKGKIKNDTSHAHLDARRSFRRALCVKVLTSSTGGREVGITNRRVEDACARQVVDVEPAELHLHPAGGRTDAVAEKSDLFSSLMLLRFLPPPCWCLRMETTWGRKPPDPLRDTEPTY
ncbi:hypothetical protein Q8A73_004153 [Channa argus]|nr:hypothetical protein Q8A73_004153 [Channa argus]